MVRRKAQYMKLQLMTLRNLISEAQSEKELLCLSRLEMIELYYECVFEMRKNRIFSMFLFNDYKYRLLCAYSLAISQLSLLLSHPIKEVMWWLDKAIDHSKKAATLEKAIEFTAMALSSIPIKRQVDRRRYVKERIEQLKNIGVKSDPGEWGSLIEVLVQ